MINDLDVLAGLSLCGVLPFLLLAFCFWRMVRNIAERNLATVDDRARAVSVYAVIVGLVAGCYVLGGIGLAVTTMARQGFEPEVMGGGASGIVGVFVAMSTIPAFIVAGQLRRLDSDTQDQLEIEIDDSTGWLEIFGWVSVTFAALIVAFMFGVALIPFAMVLLLAVPTVVWYQRRNQEAQLLWLLALAIRQKRDLGNEVLAQARSWPGFYGKRLRELASHLNSGRSLTTSLILCRPEPISVLTWLLGAGFCVITGGLGLVLVFLLLVFRRSGIVPAWCLTAIRTAEENNTLDVALTECATQHLTWLKDRFRAGSLSGMLFYLCGYLFAVAAIVSFLFYAIVPKFKKIFEGFGVELPELTKHMIAFADLMVFVVFSTPVALLLPLMPVGILLLLLADHHGWRNLRLRWFAPFYRRFDASEILRYLSYTVERGQPLTEALLATANNHHRPVIAEDFAEILSRVESGANCWTQLWAWGYLNKRDLAVVESAERAGNLPWALREVARSRERRLQHRMDVLLILLRPVCIVAMGLLVGFIATSMFLPIVTLMSDLSSYQTAE